MSGSPKYTTVHFEAQRQAQLAAARRQREMERRQRQEEARQRRVQAGARSAQVRATHLATRLHGLSEQASGLGVATDVGQASTDLSGLTGQLSQVTDEASLKRVNRDLVAAERRADALASQIAQELTRLRRAGTVELILAQLATLTDRERLDPHGHREVEMFVAAAQQQVGNEKGFAAAHASLADAAAKHADRVRDLQSLLAALASEADDTAALLATVFDDARSAGLVLPELATAEQKLATVLADIQAQRVDRSQQEIAALRGEVDRLSGIVDARLDQLDRLSIVVQAATAAMPRAGLRVVPGSLAEGDGGVTFVAERSDGTPIEVTIHAGDDTGTVLEYRVDGSDVVVTQVPDGEVRTCDLTEELLERFHAELSTEDLRAEKLRWVGQPRPDVFQAKRRPESTGGQRSTT